MSINKHLTFGSRYSVPNTLPPPSVTVTVPITVTATLPLTMAATTTIKVPHLGGISAGYRLSDDRIDPAKPTVVLINSMCTTSSLYNTQFESASLTSAVNLLAIEPLGHGATSSTAEHFTYWDSAIMALQVMDALGVKEAFALGTSQGGWMVVRMALLAPEKVSALLYIIFYMPRALPCTLHRTSSADMIPRLADPRPFAIGHIHGLRVRSLAREGLLGSQDPADALLREMVHAFT